MGGAMINNAALDVAIGVILMYLMLSLLCTVVNEFIAPQLDLRAKTLAAALQQLLDSDVLRNAFYDQGLIAGTRQTLAKESSTLWRAIVPFVSKPVTAANPGGPPVAPAAPPSDPANVAGMAIALVAPVDVQAAAPAAAPGALTHAGDHPSYISSDTFVQALIGSLTGTRLAAGQPAPTFADIKAAIEKLPESKIKSALLSSLAVAGNDVDKFCASVATWFDDSMERLSGAYRRYMKWISLIIGLVVTIAFNADTIGVTKALWSDTALRQQVVDAATAAVNTPDAPSPTCKAATESKPPVTASSNPPAATPSNAPAPAPSSLDKLKDAVSVTADCLRPFPIGWTTARWADWKSWVPTDWPWSTILGWIVTAIAISLGAPFWFDVLTKFISIRGTGPKPKRGDDTA